jgi:hypothetical protein
MGLQVQPGKVHKFVDYNEFEEVPTAVPGSFRRTKIPSERVSKFYFGDKSILKKAPPIPAKHRTHKYYFILDNGGLPFLLYHSSRSVYVYARDDNTHVPDAVWRATSRARRRGFYQRLVGHWTAMHVMPGKSERKEDIGSSVLLKLKGGRYVYIGSEIYEFKIEDKSDPITEFYSAVESSGVPYPVALSTRRAYLLRVRGSTDRAGPDTTSRRGKLRAHNAYYARHYDGTRPVKKLEVLKYASP